MKRLTSTALWGALAIIAMLVCISPTSAQPMFTEVAAQLGLRDTLAHGCDIHWYDYDNDGDLDMELGHRFGSVFTLYRNDGGSFTRLDDMGFPTNWDAGIGGVMDFDHDGDLDVFCRCYHSPSPMLVYENGRYVDRTLELGLPWETGTRGCQWVDFDRDGWMDILWGHYQSGFHLYRNVNGTHFEDITASTQLPALEDFSELCEADIDHDGDVDVFNTLLGGENHLFRNDGDGVFTDITVAAGLSGAHGQIDCKWADFDGDGWVDLLTQGTDRHTIWHNNRNLTFTEMNVHGTETDWGDWETFGAQYSIADYDMDKDLDFYAVRPGGCGQYGAPNQFFIQDSVRGLDIWFHDIAPELGMNMFANGSSTAADIDGDGDLDLCVSSFDEPLRIYRNNTVSVNYLQVRVLGPLGEQDRWHTRVELYRHGTTQIVNSAELNTSNVNRNGMNAYFVADADQHYDVRLYFPCGAAMGPENHAQLSDVVPAAVGHLLTVHSDPAGVPGKPRFQPDDIGLITVYPNPFNASATIRYSLKKSADIGVVVYGLTGQRVADLVHGWQAAGEHHLLWNAETLPSGLYFVQVASPARILMEKVVLLK